ncbi:hypothetical protein DNTS_005899 [Danionella cerebrum]|uniref:non-specific serine/threonine protein kinase n=1 Tax=Danionella cerebrum TaxID=2873325 RepID=A0A553R8Z9_9TELE|nr:hypothetical protein DNTS_005899 [Danionella translucida]
MVEVEHEGSFHSSWSSPYTRVKNLTPCLSVEEPDPLICPSQPDSHVSSEAENIEAHGLFVDCTNEDFSWKPKEDEKLSETIMPYDPNCTSTTFHHLDFLKEARPCAALDLPPNRTIYEKKLKHGQTPFNTVDSSEDQFISYFTETSPLSSEDPRRKLDSLNCNINKELSKLLLARGERFMVSEDKCIAYVTLDSAEFRDIGPLSSYSKEHKTDMPHKTSKACSEGKPRSKQKEKTDDKQQHGSQASRKQEMLPQSQLKNELNSEGAGCADQPVAVIETIVITEKIIPKFQGKKKKKHGQHGTPKSENDAPSEGKSSFQKNSSFKTENNEVKASNALNKPASHLSPKMNITNKESTPKVMSTRPKVEPSLSVGAKMAHDGVNAILKATPIKLKVDASNIAKMENKTSTSDSSSTCSSSTLNDDIKRRRIGEDQSGSAPIRTRPQLPAIFRQARNDGEDMSRRPYSEVVKQKIPKPKEVVVPRVVAEIQAEPVPADPQNILLWCQFSPVSSDANIKWTKEETVLSEMSEVEKLDERFTLTISKACSKDLGLYKCSLSATNVSVSTSEYHLTSEVLMELVIPSHEQHAEPGIVDGDEESIQCSPLLFKEDFLSDQYFGENQPASILTEKVHFGEGMHRKAFRTTLREGNLPRFRPGHPCVLKVHNAINYGTKSIEELIQKNYSLAVENTAREYIKAYNCVARSAEAFGEVPEIIPIYLVHRPSNEIPYATLEEELLGDFVKYSVRDGKEINLMRKDSEAGQKCCAFQHWVYSQTEGNLLVTDMQGVGMRLTDVGIATGKKGYKGFRGNCATTFIDQFKALHQCNRYCEILGLMSLQPKPKRTVAAAKPKTQSVPKKKTLGSVLSGKS